MGTSAMLFSVTEHFVKTARHASFYLASGPEAGPLIIFVTNRRSPDSLY